MEHLSIEEKKEIFQKAFRIVVKQMKLGSGLNNIVFIEEESERLQTYRIPIYPEIPIPFVAQVRNMIRSARLNINEEISFYMNNEQLFRQKGFPDLLKDTIAVYHSKELFYTTSSVIIGDDDIEYDVKFLTSKVRIEPDTR